MLISEMGQAWAATAVAMAVIGLGSWLYAAIQPEPTRPCGSEGGPPVTAARIRLRDGRHLAYAERGVPKKTARFKIIFCHGFSGSRLDGIGASSEIMEELGVYMVTYDRAGHGESDPNPRRSRRSEASDIKELADALELGSKFYVIGLSLGGHSIWSSIKYIPGRLAGAALLAPVINYRWPGFPKKLSKEAYKKQDVGDQWTLRVSYYTPWLLHWWMKQSWLPTSTAIKGITALPNNLHCHQGIHESYYRDMMVMFGKWEFDPMDLQPSPFPVHLWQGSEDGVVPVMLQRYICHHLSWIKYHELPMTGHFLARVPGFGDIVLKTLLVQPST